MLTIKHSSIGKWSGTVEKGSGEFVIGKSGIRLPFNLKSRMGENSATNPEELIASALGGCYAMSLANELASNGTPSDRVRAEATVHLQQGESGFEINVVDLVAIAAVPGLSDDIFQSVAARAKAACPVSNLLNAEVNLMASLTGDEA
jgi:osmotically inducible protein OsmC